MEKKSYGMMALIPALQELNFTSWLDSLQNHHLKMKMQKRLFKKLQKSQKMTLKVINL